MAKWDGEQMANARLIVSVGLEMGMSSRDITTALVAAMQESSLRNTSGGDHDSAGLFQQRPSMGWGSYAQVTNPLYASRKFFSTLRGVKNRGNLSIGGAAQAVQRSAFPGAYARWVDDASRLVSSTGIQGQLTFPLQPPTMELGDVGYLAGTTPGVGAVTEEQPETGTGALGVQAATEQPQQPVPPQGLQTNQADLSKLVNKALAGVQAHASGIRGKLVSSAMSALGTPYVWGGVGPNGYDCSGLIYKFYNKLGVKVPRIAHDQAAIGHRAPISSLEPGDFIGFGSDTHHIAIYIGNGRILEAAHSGTNVRTRALGKGEGWGVHLNLPGGGGAAGGEKVPDFSGLASTASQPLLNFPGLEEYGQEI